MDKSHVFMLVFTNLPHVYFATAVPSRKISYMVVWTDIPCVAKEPVQIENELLAPGAPTSTSPALGLDKASAPGKIACAWCGLHVCWR